LKSYSDADERGIWAILKNRVQQEPFNLIATLIFFLAKETLLATAVHPSLPQSLAWVLPVASVVTGALMLALAGMLVGDTFTGRQQLMRLARPQSGWISP
jgi:uncharacterized membrane protein (DUF4010 family)